MKNLESALQESPSTVAVSDAGGKEKSLSIVRVQDLKSLQGVMPYLAHNELVQAYVMKRFRDPDTLILQHEKSVVVASVLEHDFFGRVCILAWAQNPEHVSTRKVQQTVEMWAKDRGATHLIAFLDENGPWKRIKGLMRLTGLKPYRMVFSREL